MELQPIHLQKERFFCTLIIYYERIQRDNPASDNRVAFTTYDAKPGNMRAIPGYKRFVFAKANFWMLRALLSSFVNSKLASFVYWLCHSV